MEYFEATLQCSCKILEYCERFLKTLRDFKRLRKILRDFRDFRRYNLLFPPCVALTIVDTDDANCDGFTFVSTDAVVAVHKSIDYLYTEWKPRPSKVVYLNCPIHCWTIIVQSSKSYPKYSSSFPFLSFLSNLI